MIKKTILQPIMEEVLTQTGVQEISVWETSDGTEHYTAASAIKHEWDLSVKRENFSFPHYAVSFHFNNIEDLKEYERESYSYYKKIKFDPRNFTFPCHMVAFVEPDPDADYGCELLSLVPYQEFRKMIIEKLDKVI